MNIVILGAGYAGLASALRLSNRARGRAAITLVNASDTFVDRIRSHQTLAGQAVKAPRLESMLRGSDVRLRIGRVEAIDPKGSVVVDGHRLSFDRLVIALGSRTDEGAIEGLREHAYTLDSGSLRRLAETLPQLAASGGHLVVIGGGLSGIEAASELKESDNRLRITLLTSGLVAEGFSQAGREHVLDALARIGVAVEENATVRRIAKGGLELGERNLPADAQLFTGGFVAPELLRESGLPVNARGQVLVDAFLRAKGEGNIHVIGDCAAMEAPPYPMTMGCKTALPMGIHVAESLACSLEGKAETPFDYADTIYCISLGRRDALIQPMRMSGMPTSWILRGRLGAFIKEGICRSVSWALEAERRGYPIFAWRRTGRAALEAVRDRKALPV